MKEVVMLLIEKNKTISTMESCTGGAIVNAITNIEGSSEILKFSAVTYSNKFKIKMVVDKNIIDMYTVYSMNTADEMSKNIANFTNSNYGIGITGQINKADPNNITNENDKIYISVYDKDNNKFYNKKVDAINATREENKKMIVDNIIEILKSIIKSDV